MQMLTHVSVCVYVCMCVNMCVCAIIPLSPLSPSTIDCIAQACSLVRASWRKVSEREGDAMCVCMCRCSSNNDDASVLQHECDSSDANMCCMNVSPLFLSLFPSFRSAVLPAPLSFIDSAGIALAPKERELRYPAYKDVRFGWGKEHQIVPASCQNSGANAHSQNTTEAIGCLGHMWMQVEMSCQ